MYEIAIGDPVAGYTILKSPTPGAYSIKTIVNFTFSAASFVEESIEMQVDGTIAQISAFLATLENIIQRAILYDRVAYSSPQYLRFQLSAADHYYFTPISNIFLAANPAGYLTHQAGSKLIILHYTRPNHFTGPKTALPLTGRAGNDVVGPYPLVNHTDAGVNHGSTVLVKKASIATTLPAPLRIEYTFKSAGAARLKDLFVGVYHHPTEDTDVPFFAYYNDIPGDSSHASANAIQGNYARRGWTSAVYVTFCTYLVDTAVINMFDGRSYRPILHLFAAHAYTDLYFKVTVERFGELLFTSEPVHSPPGYGYVVLPPIEIPPNYLLREVAPARVQVVLKAWRISGAATTIDYDCLTLFPLAYAATFYGFNNTALDEVLVDDSFRSRSNVRLTAASGESTRHSRVGGPLLLMPGSLSRLFFYAADHNNLMPIDHIANLEVFYYPRLRLL